MNKITRNYSGIRNTSFLKKKPTSTKYCILKVYCSTVQLQTIENMSIIYIKNRLVIAYSYRTFGLLKQGANAYIQ